MLKNVPFPLNKNTYRHKFAEVCSLVLQIHHPSVLLRKCLRTGFRYRISQKGETRSKTAKPLNQNGV